MLARWKIVEALSLRRRVGQLLARWARCLDLIAYITISLPKCSLGHVADEDLQLVYRVLLLEVRCARLHQIRLLSCSGTWLACSDHGLGVELAVQPLNLALTKYILLNFVDIERDGMFLIAIRGINVL